LSASPTPGNDPCHTSGTPVASEKPTPQQTLAKMFGAVVQLPQSRP
jgi:hypothetical protein